MQPLQALALSGTIALASCAAPPVSAPSLAPRAAEAIDPRVPVVSNVAPQPVNTALAARLAELVAAARRSEGAFGAAIAEAQRLASAAGAPQSESWIVAQQALSAAVAARAPVARALGDIDALAATTLAARGGLAPADLAAIESAGAEVAEIDRAQASAIDAVQRRLGS